MFKSLPTIIRTSSRSIEVESILNRGITRICQGGFPPNVAGACRMMWGYA